MCFSSGVRIAWHVLVVLVSTPSQLLTGGRAVSVRKLAFVVLYPVNE